MNASRNASRVAYALILAVLFAIAGTRPGWARDDLDRPRMERVSLSNTPRQVSNLSDLAVSGRNVHLAWREEVDGDSHSQELRFQSSTDGGNTFGPGPSGRVIAAIPGHETVFSIRVAAHGGDVYVMFTSGLTPGLAQVSLMRSDDSGASFSPQRKIERAGGSPNADFAVDGKGRLHIVVEDRGVTADIFYLQSSDGGDTFSPEVNISNSEARSLEPRIASSGNRLAVVWHDVVDQGGAPAHGEIHFALSSESGAAFSNSRNLSNSVENSRSPAIAWSDSIHVVWAEGSTVTHARSLDDGTSFLSATVIGSAAAGESIQSPRVAASGQSVRVAWNTVDSNGAARGPFLRRSHASGESFSPQVDLSEGLTGGAFGAASIVAASSDRIVFPHTSSGAARDSEILVVKSAAIACGVSWLNPVSGLWSDATKWSPAVVPGPGSNVCIAANGNYTVTSTGNRNVNSLQVGSPGNLQQPTLIIQNNFDADTDLINDGNIQMGVLTLTVGTDQPAPNPRLGVLTNTATGTFTTIGAGNRAISGNIVNAGAFTIQSNTINIQSSPSLVTNSGTFTIAATAVFVLGNNGVFNQNGGNLVVDPLGKFDLNAGFSDGGDLLNYNGGNITGTVGVTGHSRLFLGPNSGGSGTFVAKDSIFGAARLSGNVKAGQHIQILSGPTTNNGVTLQPFGPFTNAGTITVDSLANATQGATLDITAGTLTNTGILRVGNAANVGKVIRGSIHNEETGTIEVHDAASFTGTSQSLTNEGTITVFPGGRIDLGVVHTVNQNAGLLDVQGVFELATGGNQGPDSFNFNGGDINGTISLRATSRLVIGPNSTGRGEFLFHLSDGIPGAAFLAGKVAANQKVIVRAETLAANGGVSVQVADGVENHGTIRLESLGNSNQGTTLTPLGNFINHHMIEIEADTVLDAALRRVIRGNLTNHGTIDIKDHVAITGTSNTFTNDGTVHVFAGATVQLGNATVVRQDAGLLNIEGTFTLDTGGNEGSDRFQFNGGEIEGSVIMNRTSILNIGTGSVGKGTFVFGMGTVAFVGPSSITGNVAPAQTIIIRGQTATGGTAALTATNGFTNAGVITLDSTPGSTGGALFNVTNGTLTNNGTINIGATSLAAGKSITANIENFGTINIDDDVTITGTSRTFTNRGTVDINAGVVTFGNAHVFNQQAGTLQIGGSLRLETGGNEGFDTFNFNGGVIQGRVSLFNNSRLNIGAGSAGAAEFQFGQNLAFGAAVLTGNVAAGQTLIIQGETAGGTTVTAANGFTNAGVIRIDSAANTTNGATLNVTAGTLLNTGTLTIGNANLASGKVLNANLDNRGVFNILDSLTFSRLSATYSNSGTIRIDPGQVFIVGGNSSFSNPGGAFAGGGSFTLQSNSTFTGFGMMEALVRNEGRFRPGSSPGILNITGTYTQTATGILDIEVGGPLPGQYDQINVSGVAALAGTLNVTLFGSYCPGGIFDFLTFAAHTGDFAGSKVFNAGGGRSLTASLFPTAAPTIYRLTTTGPLCPVAVNDSYTTGESTLLTVAAPGVLSNDQGQSLTALLVTGPTHGQLTLQTNGAFEYTPEAGFTGVDTFTYKAKDPAAESAPGTVSITVTEAIAPVTTATVTPEPNAAGWNNSDVTVELQAVDNEDGAGIREIQYRLNGGALQTVFADEVTIPLTAEGTHVLEYRAVDNAGNAEALQTLTVMIDKTQPSITAPADVNASTGDACAATVNDLGTATTSDNLSTVTVMRTGVPENNLFPLGMTTITYVATDEAGNSSSDTQTVTVSDDTDPTLQAPDSITVSTGAGSCTATVDDLGNATATDNCDQSVEVTFSGVPDNHVFPLGVTTITYTATDDAGNTTTATQTVTVVDDTDPALQAPANITMSTDTGSCTATVSELGTATATDNCDSNVEITITGLPAGNVFPLGVTTITYTATDDAGNSSTATQTVTVSDDMDPSIQAPNNISVSTDAGSCSATVSNLGNAVAADNCDSSVEITISGLPAGNIFPLGVTTITYTATDDSANTSTATQTVTVTDDTDPSIQAPSNINVSTGASSCMASVGNLGSAVATDNCDSNVQITISGVPPSNIFPLGVTTITWTATDDAGNTSAATQTVTVVDDTDPSIHAPADITVSAPGAVVIADLGNHTASDHCPGVQVIISGVPAGNLFPIGSTIVTYTAIDASGNTSFDTQSVTVVEDAGDDTPPVIQCSVSPNVLWPPNQKMVDVTVTVDAHDDSGISGFVLVSVVSSEPDEGEPDIQDFVVGTPDTNGKLRAERLGKSTGRTYTLTYRVTDRAGNSSVCTPQVIVPHDHRRPTR